MRTPDAPEVPEGFEYLLEWFLELSAQRQRSMSGPQPLSFLDMQAWAALTGAKPTHDEVQVIRALDRAYLDAAADNVSRPAGNQ